MTRTERYYRQLAAIEDIEIVTGRLHALVDCSTDAKEVEALERAIGSLMRATEAIRHAQNTGHQFTVVRSIESANHDAEGPGTPAGANPPA